MQQHTERPLAATYIVSTMMVSTLSTSSFPKSFAIDFRVLSSLLFDRPAIAHFTVASFPTVKETTCCHKKYVSAQISTNESSYHSFNSPPYCFARYAVASLPVNPVDPSRTTSYFLDSRGAIIID